MGWVEIGFMGWVLAWGYLDGLERVLVSNGLGVG
jgi:hypothetical protein